MNVVARLLGPPVQVAYAVPDVVAAADRWVQEFGAGPFFVRPHVELVDVIHRGRAATFDHTSAYGQWGTVMVELMCDHGTGPSVVRDMFDEDESGLHHLAHVVDDLDGAVAAMRSRGHQVAMTARTAGGVDFRFIDAVATHGHMFELYRPSERLLAFYEMVAESARDWDGSDPIRQ